ncbi:MAG: flavin reductase family protein [Caldimicrobium sp.]|nr:flavin reductase family protein [Caldimicrobium sp.]MCX7873786.1 flavin reductase family protein [Caldimicrobium sp.]MDW8094779.1 flavin reductase family protein [Caldimicrobium sp.]
MGLQKIITTYIPQGVFIITTQVNGVINGMTAAWVSQVSFKPRLLGVAIAPQRYTYELIQKSKTFCVNVLGEDQVELARHFGFRSGRKFNKFEGIPYKHALKGSPVLLSAIAYFECEVTHQFEAGDHVIVVGEVGDYEVINPNKVPLLFRWDDYFGGVEG